MIAFLRLLGNLPSDIHRFISEHKTSAERSSLAFNILGGILSFWYALEESRFLIDLAALLSDISRKKKLSQGYLNWFILRILDDFYTCACMCESVHACVHVCMHVCMCECVHV